MGHRVYLYGGTKVSLEDDPAVYHSDMYMLDCEWSVCVCTCVYVIIIMYIYTCSGGSAIALGVSGAAWRPATITQGVSYANVSSHYFCRVIVTLLPSTDVPTAVPLARNCFSMVEWIRKTHTSVLLDSMPSQQVCMQYLGIRLIFSFLSLLSPLS